MKLSKITAAILATALPTSVFADQNTLEQIIVSANNIEQSVRSVTSEMHVITAEEIEAKHYTTLIQALNTLPGISFTQNGGLGSSTSIFLRGSSNNRTLILIDGIRANDPSSTTGANLANIMIANIERIEVIKGAQSGVWGSDAAAGVINIITKDSPDTFINTEVGSYNTKKLSVATTLKAEKTSLALSASHIETDGFTSYAPRGENIGQYEDDGYDNTNFSAKFSTDFGENGSLNVAHHHTKALSDYDAEYANPNSDGAVDAQTDLTSIEYKIDNTKLTLQQSLFTSNQKESDYTDNVEGTTQSIQLTQQLGNLILGTAYSYNKIDSEKPIYAYPAPTYIKTYQNQLLQKTDTTTVSAFANHSHEFEGVVFNEALRWDNYSNFDPKFTGKIGAKFPIDELSSISMNYGTAYNAPSLMQIVNPWGISNPSLKPENSRELSLNYTNGGFILSLFDKNIEDLIEWQSSQFQNVEGSTNIKGYEISYSKSLGKIDISTNFTRLKTEKEDGTPLARRPETQIGFDMTWYATNQLDINLNTQYIGERSEEHYTQNYSVWNANLNYQINKSISAYLKVENLFDTYYQVIDNYASAERSAYIGVNAKF